MHGKVLENGKGVCGYKNWVNMWGSNGIKLVFGLVFPNPVCGAKICFSRGKNFEDLLSLVPQFWLSGRRMSRVH